MAAPIASRGPFSLESLSPSFAARKNPRLDQNFMDLFREFPSIGRDEPQNYRTPLLLHGLTKHHRPTATRGGDPPRPPAQERENSTTKFQISTIPPTSPPHHPTTASPFTYSPTPHLPHLPHLPSPMATTSTLTYSPPTPSLAPAAEPKGLGSDALAFWLCRKSRGDFPDFGTSTDDLADWSGCSG